MEEVGRIGVRVSATADEFITVLDNVDDRLEDTGKRLKDAINDFDSFDSATEKASESLDRLKKAQEEYNNATDAAKKVIDWKVEIGELDEVTAAQQELNSSVSAYIEFRKKAGDDITAKAEEEHKKRIDELRKKYEQTAKESKKLSSQIKNFVKDLKSGNMSVEKFAHAMQSMSLAAGGFSVVKNAIGDVINAMGEAVAAYNEQATAELALSKAAEKNPYMNSTAIQSLRNYAREMQNTSNVSDNAILKAMTMLAASGRTVDETQRIVKAAADISAAGVMEFEGAVKHLSRSFSGLSGELGEVVGAVRDLTQEELKAGKAIDVIEKQYGGIASVVVSTGTQLENAKRQLNESIGALVAPRAEKWQEFWLDVYRRGAETFEKLKNEKSAADLVSGKNSKDEMKDAKKQNAKNIQERDEKQKELEKLQNASANATGAAKTAVDSKINELQKEIAMLQKSINDFEGIDFNKLVIDNMNDIELNKLIVDLSVARNNNSSDEFVNNRNKVADAGEISAGFYDRDFGYTSKAGDKEFSGSANERTNAMLDYFIDLINERLSKEKPKDTPKDTDNGGGGNTEPEKKDNYTIAKEKRDNSNAMIEDELKAQQQMGLYLTEQESARYRLEKLQQNEITFINEATQAMGLHLSASERTAEQEAERVKYQELFKAEIADSADSVLALAGNYEKIAKATEKTGNAIDGANALAEEQANYVDSIYKTEKKLSEQIHEQSKKMERLAIDAEEVLLSETEHKATIEGILKLENDNIALLETELAMKVASKELSEQEADAVLAIVNARQTAIKLGEAYNETTRAETKEKTDAILEGNKKEPSALQQHVGNVKAIKQRQKDIKTEKNLKRDAIIQEVEIKYIDSETQEEKLLTSWADFQAHRYDIAAKYNDDIVAMNEKMHEELADLESESTALTKASFQEKMAAASEVMTMVADAANQIGGAVQGLFDAQRQNLQDSTDAERTEIARQYNEGIISYEEYCDKKAALEKKSAMEEYKIKLNEWKMNMALAVVNTAQAVLMAFAQGGPFVGAVMAAVAAATGAIQIATIAANKPKPPSFATGGVVGGFNGASMGGDNTTANVRNGEMILNAKQQKQLWGMANGQGSPAESGGISLNVNVVNNAAKDVETRQTYNTDGLTVIIDKIVSHGLSTGRYSESLSKNNEREQGERWL